MTLTRLAVDLIEEINGLAILINGESLTPQIESALQNESIEKLIEIRDSMKYQEVVGVLWTAED